MAPKEEKDHMLSIFSSLDLNGDGQLSREELIIGKENFHQNEIIF